MKESLWGYYLILLGIMVSTVMILMSNMVTTNQQDYYLLKEVTNAAMLDSIDWSYYRKYGEIKTNTEKFVENFLRRFSESVSKTNTYKIDFYSIYENPPSVSIKVTSKTGDFQIAGDSTNIDVVNSYDAILESNNNVFSDDKDGNGNFKDSFIFYSVPYGSCDEIDKYKDGYCQMSNKALLQFKENSALVKGIKTKVDNYYKKMGINKKFDMKNLKVLDVHYLTTLSTDDDWEMYKNQFNDTYEYEANTQSVKTNLGVKYGEFFTQNVKNVKISLVNKNNNTYLIYGLDYNCDGAKRFNNDNSIGQYRIKETDSSKYNNIRSEYISLEEYNNKSTEEKNKYEWTPFYNACLVGIKYKVDFYYDY